MTATPQVKTKDFRHFSFTDSPELTERIEELRRLRGDRSHAAVLREIVRSGVEAQLSTASC